MVNGRSFRRDGGAGEEKLAEFAAVVHFKADGIPKRRCQLPFSDQAGRFAFEQLLGIQGRKGHILIVYRRIRHVNTAFGVLFGGCGFAAPFGAFN